MCDFVCCMGELVKIDCIDVCVLCVFVWVICFVLCGILDVVMWELVELLARWC